jgi:hypothetical protein
MYTSQLNTCVLLPRVPKIGRKCGYEQQKTVDGTVQWDYSLILRSSDCTPGLSTVGLCRLLRGSSSSTRLLAEKRLIARGGAALSFHV